MKYWLMKSEPDTFSIADLARVKVEPWTGVRSTFARFHMRAMSVGDLVLFYHSSVVPPGAVGTARVVKTGVVDETQFDPASPYFDEKATREKPIWDCVDVEYIATFPHLVSLDRIRADPDLANMPVLRIGRLSVQPCSEAEYERVVALGQIEAPPVVKVRAKAKAAPSKPRSKAAPAKPRSNAKPTSTAKPKSKAKPGRARAGARARARAER